MKLPIILLTLLLSGCTTTCRGKSELGSKSRPLRFLVAKQNDVALTSQFSNLVTCIESTQGVRISFETAANDKAVTASLARGDAHFGLLPAFEYVSAAQKQNLLAMLISTKEGNPSSRSVILGKTLVWREHLPYPKHITFNSNIQRKHKDILKPITGDRFAYTSPDSDFGFYIPRLLLFEQNVFPSEAVFTGSTETLLQAIDRELVIAGASHEQPLQKIFLRNTPFIPGEEFANFIVLDVSPPLPGNVVVTNADFSQRYSQATQQGLQRCFKNAKNAWLEKIFGGDGFIVANSELFALLEGLTNFQAKHPRILTLQISKPNDPQTDY